MSLSTRVGLLAGASALSLSAVSLAGTPTQNQETRIAELEAKVAELSGNSWLTETRSEEIRGVVNDVLADADTRASMLSSAGYRNGFTLGNPDSGFDMTLNGQMQFRWILNNQDDLAAADTTRAGFENTRTKLMFNGTVAGWGYRVQGDFNRMGGGFGLEDAYMSRDMGNGWTFVAGQFKVPLNHEWMVDSSQQLAVERSNVSYLYNGGRTQGVHVHYRNDTFEFYGSFNDGAGSANTPWSMYDTEYAFTGRAAILTAGTWDQFESLSSPVGSPFGWMAGAGIHYQDGEYGTGATETELTVVSVDTTLQFDGATVHAAYNYASADSGAASIDTNGFVVQGGLFLNNMVEAFVRYEWNDFDNVPVGVDDLSILTAGVNVYYNPNLKLTADVGFGLDAVSSSSDITGFRNDAANEDGQLVIRSQLQLTF